MIYRRLDVNGDMSLGHGRSDFITEKEAVAQAILTRLKWLYNEWWERQGTGFPLFEQVLTYGAQQQKLDILYAEWIKGTKNVLDVTSLVSSVVNRAYTMTCRVRTAFGTIVIIKAEPEASTSEVITTEYGRIITEDGQYIAVEGA